MGDCDNKFTIWKTGATSWATERAHRGYTCAIAYAALTGYTLTITGSGAPAAAPYPTLRNAKNAFRKFLHDKPVS